jgi:hypothetical protein
MHMLLGMPTTASLPAPTQTQCIPWHATAQLCLPTLAPTLIHTLTYCRGATPINLLPGGPPAHPLPPRLPAASPAMIIISATSPLLGDSHWERRDIVTRGLPASRSSPGTWTLASGRGISMQPWRSRYLHGGGGSEDYAVGGTETQEEGCGVVWCMQDSGSAVWAI